MGRTNGAKPKTSGAKTQSVKNFFAAGETSPFSSPKPNASVKMAAAETNALQEEGDRSEFVSRSEMVDILDVLETRFAQKVELLLKPLQSQIQEFKTTLQEVSQTAEMALEQSITSQGEVRDLQAGEQRIMDRLLDLENSHRFKNLKFRAIPEKAEDNTELTCFMASWLATELALENGVAPMIERAYRQGSRTNRKNNTNPRDIVVRFADERTRNKILKEANSRGSLTYQRTNISVFPDLSAETLQRRRELKPITANLREAKIPYRWISHYRLSVLHSGKAIQATDMASGCELLARIGIPSQKIPTLPTDNDDSIQKYTWKRIPVK